MKNPPIRVAMVCTGNICSSPMAEVVFAAMVREDPELRDRVTVTSAGTARWHVGSPMDPRARAALDRAGFTAPGSLGAYADRHYLDSQDVVVVMTREHRLDVMARLTNPHTEVLLLRSLAEPGDLDLADPYYGDDADFDHCCAQISRTVRCLTSEFRRRLGADSYEA